MSILSSIISGITPSISKGHAIKTLEDIFDSIDKTLLPILNLPKDIGAGSPLVQDIRKRFISNRAKMPGFKGDDPIEYIRMVYTDFVNNRKAIITLLEARFKNDVLKEALDYETANMIMYINALSFANDYVRKLLVVITRTVVPDPYKPVDKIYVEYITNRGYLEGFCDVLACMAQKPTKLADTFEKLRGISYDASNEKINERINPDVGNPLRIGFLPESVNIFRWFGTIYNNMVVWWRDRQVTLKEKVEEQIRYHEMQKAGASPEELAEINRRIAKYSEILMKIEQSIEDIENDANR